MDRFNKEKITKIRSGIEQADFNNRYKVLVLTTIKSAKSGDISGRNLKEATGVVKSNTILEAKDILVMFGELMDILLRPRIFFCFCTLIVPC